jgi:hypothetical protein
MFDHFTLAGLTITNLQTQVLGILGNPFVVGGLIALLASGFAVRVASVLKDIVWGVQHGYYDSFGDVAKDYGRGLIGQDFHGSDQDD